MIRDITLGQYYPAKSVIHQLDPRVKLVATMLYIISLFVAKGILGYVIATIFLAFVIRTSKVPFKFITKGLKAIVMLLMITVVFNLFLIDGDVVLWHFGFLKITDKGLRTAILMGVRLIYLIIGSSLMTLTTTPNDLTDGMERLLNPLKAVHVPVHEIRILFDFFCKVSCQQICLHLCSKNDSHHLCIPQSQRSGHGHGGPLLSWR